MSNKNKKDNNLDKEKEQNPELQQEQTNNNDSKKLNEEIAKLQQQNLSLTLEVQNLKNEISKLNEDYVNKVTLKAQEAQKILNEKKAELENKLVDDVNNKINLYIEKNFAPFLDCLNQLSKIINIETTNNEIKNYLIGFNMIMNLFNQTLNNMDIYKLEIKSNDQFDEQLMEAFELVDVDGIKSNHVVEVISDGYRYKDKIIKHALVKLQK